MSGKVGGGGLVTGVGRAGVHVVSRETGDGRTEDDFIEGNRVSKY
jgi:hypothetical protein